MEAALEAGADDVVSEGDGSIEVITTPETYAEVKAAMKAAGLSPENAEITMRASLEVELDVESGEKVLRLLEALEDLDDTQDVYSNADPGSTPSMRMAAISIPAIRHVIGPLG